MLAPMLRANGLLQKLIQNSPTPVVLVSDQGTLLFANRACRELLQIDLDDQQLHLIELHAVEDRAEAMVFLEQLRQRAVLQFEIACQRRDGSQFPAEITAMRIEIDGEMMIQSTLRDLSDSRRLSELRRSYETMLASTPALISLVGRGYIYRAVNDQYERMFGKVRKQIVGHPCQDLHGVEDFENIVRPILDPAFAGDNNEVQAWVATADGRRRYMEVLAQPVRGSDGEVEGVVVTSRDITRQRKLQDVIIELATAERFHRGDFDAAVALATEKVADALEILATEVWLQGPNDPEPTCIDRYQLSVASHQRSEQFPAGEPATLFEELEERSSAVGPLSANPAKPHRRQGSELYVAIRASGRTAGLLRLEAGEPREWLKTERGQLVEIASLLAQALLNRQQRELKDELTLAHKRESLGIMAGGIAHDFNNLLVGILGGIDYALTLLPEDAETRPELEVAAEGAERAADLCHQMLTYAGRGSFRRQTVDLNEELRSAARLMRRRLGYGIRLSFELYREELPVRVDPTQLQQVVMNLLANASDAYDGSKGEVWLNTSLLGLQQIQDLPGLVVRPASIANKWACLEVGDRGTGMSAAVQARIFDPFFTNKPQGRGLGLAAVLGAVESHQGGLAIDSQEHRGSRFRVFLPLCEAPVETPQKPLPPTAEEGGKLLIVDDESAVRTILRRMLESAGFEVESASNGHQALAIYSRTPDFDVVVLDLRMPGMDGGETLRQLRLLDPRVKVLVATGFAEEEVADRLRDSPADRLLQKPFRRALLLDTVRELQAARHSEVSPPS